MSLKEKTVRQYKGDENLVDLLKDGGVKYHIAEIYELLSHIAAAPDEFIHEGNRPSWEILIGDDISDELSIELSLLKAKISGEQSKYLASAGFGKIQESRLKSLRKSMADNGYDGYFVPHADAYMGEYIPSHDERLTWLTGFKGSAGNALVLGKKAAIQVDGRYTLQVKEQVDVSKYDMLNFPKDSLCDWAGGVFKSAKNEGKKKKIAYDPWLHSLDWVEKTKKELALVGIELVASENNLIDELWQNQPPKPLSAVEVFDENIAGKNFEEKLSELAQNLKKEGVGAVVLSQPDAIAWLLNIRGKDVPHTPFALSFAIIHDDGRADWFIDGRKISDNIRDYLGSRVRIFEPAQFGGKLDNLKANNKPVRINPANSAAWIGQRLEKSGVKLNKGQDLCSMPKARKNSAEAAAMVAAHKRDAVAMVRFLSWLEERTKKTGLTEIAAADRLFAFRAEAPEFRDLSFGTISGAGSNGAIVHYSVSEKTNKELKKGELYLVDSGAQYKDGTTDITRTIAIGKPTVAQKRHYTLVLKGHIAVDSAKFPKGTNGVQIDALARQPLWKHGLDFAHGTGHGVGCYLSVHEGPIGIHARAKTSFEKGMIVSNEPGFYKAGEYGIRIENLIIVEKAKKVKDAEQEMFAFKSLTLCPMDLNLVDVSMLNKDEINWLNDYHQRVLKEVIPLLKASKALDSDKALKWLKKATLKIEPAQNKPLEPKKGKHL